MLLNKKQEPTYNPSTFPTVNPTNAPTPLQYCPPAYDTSRTDYVVGDLVESELYIFQCSSGPNKRMYQMYEPYCNVADSSSLSESELELWNVAWIPLQECYTTVHPTVSPSYRPSNLPSSSILPSMLPTDLPTLSVS